MLGWGLEGKALVKESAFELLSARIKKAAAAIYSWDYHLLLTFIYPGFDCGSCQP